MDLALLILRVAIGAFFVGHGAQKLFGAFGGHGLAGTGRFFESLGMRPGRLQAMAAGTAELLGGSLLLLGLFTPLAALMIIAVMTVAIITVHASKGPWASEGGYEYTVVLIAGAVALAGAGAGEWSLDGALDLDIAGTGYALGALGMGLLGGLAAVLVGRSGAVARDTSARTGTGRFTNASPAASTRPAAPAEPEPAPIERNQDVLEDVPPRR